MWIPPHPNGEKNYLCGGQTLKRNLVYGVIYPSVPSVGLKVLKLLWIHMPLAPSPNIIHSIKFLAASHLFIQAMQSMTFIMQSQNHCQVLHQQQ